MEKNSKISPFIIKPLRINNYTHFIALLKLKQKKYKDFSYSILNHSFSKVLSKDTEIMNLNDAIDGFLHQKLKEKAKEYEEGVYCDLNESLNKKIKELRVENDLKVHGTKIGNIKEVEGHLFSKPSILTFKDELLFDMYEYLRSNNEPLTFLNNAYLKFVKKFFSDSQLKQDIQELDLNDIENLVREYVKIRYNRDEHDIEVYESRYLWAEIFVLFRIGRTDIIKKLLNEYEVFFEFMANKFKSSFLSYLEGRKTSVSGGPTSKDKFQHFLYDIIEEKALSDGFVIAKAEDYLWMKIIMGHDIKNEIDNFNNNKIKFMISIFTKKYKKAIDFLMKSDFGVVSKFFLLRELCFEKQYEKNFAEIESSNVFDKANKIFISKGKYNKNFCEESSDTVSMQSGSDASFGSINTFFLNFLFSVVSKLSTKEYKVKLIEMLKNHSDYYNAVPNYIIKYSLFDILGKSSESHDEIEYSLDSRLASRVLEKLREHGDNQKLIQLRHLIDDIDMIHLLVDLIEEAILVDGTVDQTIVEKYIVKKISKDSEKLISMYDFYKFYRNPTFQSLRSTILFNQNTNLDDFKFVIEKIFYKAAEVVKNENNKLMAKTLFKLCGSLGLHESCMAKISKDLVKLL